MLAPPATPSRAWSLHGSAIATSAHVQHQQWPAFAHISSAARARPLLRRRHCPVFGVDKMVAIPLPKPNEVELGIEDDYKLQLLVRLAARTRVPLLGSLVRHCSLILSTF